MKLKFFIIALLSVTRFDSYAQLNPIGSMYFQNQFLVNPAFAGVHGGLDLNLAIRKQWSKLPGSPNTQTLTAAYSVNEKVGLGLNLFNDQSGLFRRTRTVASYAYRLPLNGQDKKLAFGISLGFSNERIALEDLNGDAEDISVNNYNLRDTYIDGNFGIAYTSNKLNLQAAMPNMKDVLKKDEAGGEVNRETFFTAVSYTIRLDETASFGVEPKLVYRGLRGTENVIDAGANLSYENNKVNLFGMYHSTGSSTFGVALNYNNLGFTGMYSTATSALGNYTNGNFEMGLRLSLLK